MKKKAARTRCSSRMRRTVGAVSGKGPSSKVKVTSRRPMSGGRAGPSASSHARTAVCCGFRRGQGGAGSGKDEGLDLGGGCFSSGGGRGARRCAGRQPRAPLPRPRRWPAPPRRRPSAHRVGPCRARFRRPAQRQGQSAREKADIGLPRIVEGGRGRGPSYGRCPASGPRVPSRATTGIARPPRRECVAHRRARPACRAARSPRAPPATCRPDRRTRARRRTRRSRARRAAARGARGTPAPALPRPRPRDSSRRATPRVARRDRVSSCSRSR